MSGIDPYIDLYFKDLQEDESARPEVLIEMAKDLGPLMEEARMRNMWSLEASEDLKVLDVNPDAGLIRAKATPQAQRTLIKCEEIAAVVPVARPARISVLVGLRRPGWDREIPGFTRGAVLGTIVTGMATKEAVRLLKKDPDVFSVEASRDGGTGACMNSIPFVKASLVHAATVPQKGRDVLIAIIDTGMDVLHTAFQDAAGQTRLVGVWDQLSSVGPTPDQAASAGITAGARYAQTFGRYHSEADLNGYIAAGAVPVDLGRDYTLLSVSPQGHGTHVASIAAGSPFVSAGSTNSVHDGLNFPGGVAPEARLLFIRPQTTAKAGDPESIGYSGAHVAALEFIKETARALGMPVVVNVSLGMNAGAHDGTSLLEAAFDEFSGGGREEGRVIVKSAGNNQGTDSHAEVTVPPASSGRSGCIEWRSSSVSRKQDYLEFWFASADDLIFELTFQGSAGRAKVDRSNLSDSFPLPSGATVEATLMRFHHDNGDARLTVVVRDNANQAISDAGNWKLEIWGGQVVAGGVVHGWLEISTGQPLVFITGVSADQTLTIPGTARTVVCVGACDMATPAAVPAFSSVGPSRDARRKPELTAPGLDILAAESNTTHGLAPMKGTSMAAPHVAGAVALLMGQQLQRGGPQVNAAQVRAALSQSTQGFTGVWTPDGGHGPLDVQALLNLF